MHVIKEFLSVPDIGEEVDKYNQWFINSVYNFIFGKTDRVIWNITLAQRMWNNRFRSLE